MTTREHVLAILEAVSDLDYDVMLLVNRLSKDGDEDLLSDTEDLRKLTTNAERLADKMYRRVSDG